MIQPFSAWSGFISDLLAESANAAAALPLIMILTILIGRRSHADLVEYGVKCLRSLAMCLAIPGLAGFALPVFLILGRWPEPVTLNSLFHPVILPWTMACSFWLLAFALLALVRRTAIWPCLVALLLALAAVIVCNWPFAGLPQAMEPATVFAVLTLQAWHKLFLGLSLGGGFALVLIPFWQRICQSGLVSLGEGNRAGARRWLSFWACLGAVPFLVDRWGLVIGNLLHHSASSVVDAMLARLAPLSMAVFCWAVLLALPGNTSGNRQEDLAADSMAEKKKNARSGVATGKGAEKKSGFALGFLRLTRLDPEHLAWLGLGLAVAGIVLQGLIQYGIFTFTH